MEFAVNTFAFKHLAYHWGIVKNFYVKISSVYHIESLGKLVASIHHRTVLDWAMLRPSCARQDHTHLQISCDWDRENFLWVGTRQILRRASKMPRKLV